MNQETGYSAEMQPYTWEDYSRYFEAELIKKGFPEDTAKQHLEELGEIVLTETGIALAKTRGIDISTVNFKSPEERKAFFANFTPQEYESALLESSEVEVKRYLNSFPQNEINNSQ